MGPFGHKRWCHELVVKKGGNVGIGSTGPGQRLSVAGTIESTSGGVKFPDGTVQTSAAVAPVAPSSIAGLVLWLDASSASSRFQDSGLTTAAAADGDPVGGWKDLSGNSYSFLQSTSVYRPVLKLSVQNSLPAIRFTAASNQYLAGPAALPNTYFTNSLTYTGYVVFKQTATSTFQSLFSWNQYAANASYSVLSDRYTGTGCGSVESSIFSRVNASGSGTNPCYTTTLGTTVAIHFFRWDGANIETRLNGVSAYQADATAAYASLDTITLGGLVRTGNPTGAFFFGGDVYEIGAYSRALTHTEIGKIEAYLINKWGL